MLTVKEVAAMLGVTRQTVTSLIRKGELESYRLAPNSPYRISEAQIKKYLAEHKQSNPKEGKGN